MSKKKIKLGDKVRAKISGFEGIVVSRTEWINGCIRFGVQSEKLKDGKPIEEIWFDGGDLEMVKEKKVKAKKKNTGGPMPNPKRW